MEASKIIQDELRKFNCPLIDRNCVNIHETDGMGLVFVVAFRELQDAGFFIPLFHALETDESNLRHMVWSGVADFIWIEVGGLISVLAKLTIMGKMPLGEDLDNKKELDSIISGNVKWDGEKIVFGGVEND